MALDGSARSLETVRQVARLCPFQHMDIVPFHVFSNVPECYSDLEKEAPMISSGPESFPTAQVESIQMENTQMPAPGRKLGFGIIQRSGGAEYELTIDVTTAAPETERMVQRVPTL
jgi:hypothetical protein